MSMSDNKRKELFANLYDTHVDAIFRFCLFKTGDREVAKDLSQDVFIKLFKNLNNTDPANPKGFLYTIANNTVIDYWRKSKSLTEEALPEDFFISLASTEDTEAKAQHSTFLSLLGKLDPKDQEVINLRYVEDMSSKDIAEILGERENTIIVRISRAKDKLKDLLEKIENKYE